MTDDRLYLIHILERVERIEAYTAGGREEFMRDPRTQDAVVRSLEVIGEAAKRVSDATRALAPDVPWRRISGLRDVLIHQYAGVDLGEVWQIVETGLADLKHTLRGLLCALNGCALASDPEQQRPAGASGTHTPALHLSPFPGGPESG